jgi:hypothetical protein
MAPSWQRGRAQDWRMALEFDCTTCPRRAARTTIWPAEIPGPRYCFECPAARFAVRFQALGAAGPRPAVRSCRREPPQPVAH